MEKIYLQRSYEVDEVNLSQIKIIAVSKLDRLGNDIFVKIECLLILFGNRRKVYETV